MRDPTRPPVSRTALGACLTGLLLVLSGFGCDNAADEGPVRRVLPTSADHHLHIRSQSAAEHLDRLQIALKEPGSDGETASKPVTAAAALLALDAAGLEGGVVLSNAYMFGMPEALGEAEEQHVRDENDYVAAQVALHADRLVGLCSVNLLRDYALAEVRRCGADERIVGLKLHLANSAVDLRDDGDLKSLAAVLALADSLNLAIVIHMRTRAPGYGAQDANAFIDRVLSATSQVPIQIAHMAGWGGYDDNTDAALGAFIAAGRDGRLDMTRFTFGLGAVVFQPAAAGADTAVMHRVERANAKLAERIRELGIDRVVYATDWPSWPPGGDALNGIAKNMVMIKQLLPLSIVEMDQLFANVGPLLGGRPR